MPFLNKFGDCGDCECGLVFIHENLPVPVPLQAVDIDTEVTGFTALVTVHQKYVNKEEVPIEAVYLFPVEEECAVTEFEAEVEGRKIKTVVKKKEEAKRDYDEAVKAKKTAVLLEETKPDIFKISIGFLKPGAGAKIKIKYVSELPVEGKAVRLTIPTTTSPRYKSPKDNSYESEQIAKIPYSLDTPAPLKISVTSVMNTKITSIKSPTHEVSSKIEGADEKGHFKALTTLTKTTADMDRDFVLLVETDDDQPKVYLETTPEGSTCAMVSMIPSFKLDEQKVELIFLVDRSGSMGFTHPPRIQQAQEALHLFLHSLPSDCLFNIVSFGSHFTSLFSESQEYTDDTLEQAKRHVDEMSANYGGTEIFQPLEHIFNSHPTSPHHFRQIIVLTDGDVCDDERVIRLVRSNQAKARVFALGLGDSASRHLVKGIARAGQGTAAFATTKEALTAKVMSQLKNALQPAMTDISVQWDLEGGFQTPKVVPPVFDGSRLLVYHMFDGSVPKEAKITAVSPDGPLSIVIPLEKTHSFDGGLLHKMAARKRIQELEEAGKEDEEVKKTITDLSLSHGLASKYTSFIGVDENNKVVGDFDPMETRNVPHQYGIGFSGGAGGFQPMMAMQCMPCAPPMANQFMSPMREMRMAGGGPEPEAADEYDTDDDSSFALYDCEEAIETVEKKEMPRRNVLDEAPKQEEPETKHDLVMAIAKTQSSSGLFRWSPILEKLLGHSQDEAAKKRPEGCDPELWVTALVINLLESQFKDHQDIWELFAGKAKKHMKKILGEEKAKVVMAAAAV